MTGDNDRTREQDNQDEDEFDNGSGDNGGEPEAVRSSRGKGGAPARPVSPPPPPDLLSQDDDQPDPRLVAFKRDAARAKAAEPLQPAAESLLSNEPEKVAARTAIETGYAAVAGVDPAGSLRQRYREKDRAFRGAAQDLLATTGGRRSRLEKWIDRNLLRPGAPLRALLGERQQVANRLRERAGTRELAYSDAQAGTAKAAEAWDDWSKPVETIGKIIDSYGDRIEILKDEANDRATADRSIFQLWFEVAPKHLQLRRNPVDEQNAPGIDMLRNALSDFPDVAARLDRAEDRGDGSLYLVDPAQLGQKRDEALTRWKDAATAEADAAVAYELGKDSAADLKSRDDKLKGDLWLVRAAELLTRPPQA
jgi:hypothetical protein